MKKTSHNTIQDNTLNEMLPEYNFDYPKARPNRFAATSDKATRTVVLDSDIAEVFTTSEAVRLFVLFFLLFRRQQNSINPHEKF